MEPTTGIGLTAVAVGYLGKDGINKLLGPTADYFGQGLRSLVEKRVANLNAIMSKASRKLDSSLEQPGCVNARVLKDVIEDGTFSEDRISQEYYAGVLASSRTRDGKDDRGVRILKIIERMSSYQLRAHYILYYSLAQVYHGSKKTVTNISDRKSMAVYMPMTQFIDAMDFMPAEAPTDLLSHSLHGLLDDGLLDSWLMGSHEILRRKFRDVPVKNGLIFKPSLAGAELFNSAIGRGQVRLNALLSEPVSTKDFEFQFELPGARQIVP